MRINLKRKQVLLGLAIVAAVLGEAGAAAAENPHLQLLLKPSLYLSRPAASGGPSAKELPTGWSVLANMELLRGVAVGAEPGFASGPEKPMQSEQGPSRKSSPMVKAVYGGLQIALKENLSLVYSPGRLSRQSFNSESQGLYLLTEQGKTTNWFVGIESDSSAATSETRRNTKSAQFGVILSLD